MDRKLIDFRPTVKSLTFVLARDNDNLVLRAHVPFGQHQDTGLWKKEIKILGLPASRRMRSLVYLASRDKVDVDRFHKGIQYALEKRRKVEIWL